MARKRVSETGTAKKRKHSVVIHQNGAEDTNEDPSVYDLPAEAEIQEQINNDEEPPAKKRRNGGRPDASLEVNQAAASSRQTRGKELDTSKPSALFRPVKGRHFTLSIAIPGSILMNVEKPDHKTLLASRIARSAAIFCVDEIIIYDDDPTHIPDKISPKYRLKNRTKKEILNAIDEEDQPWQNPDLFLHHVLSYAETPPHLRYGLFSRHKNLQWAGLLQSLDMPHHMKSNEWCRYREGVVLESVDARSETHPKSKSKKAKAKEGPVEQWTYVECGLPYSVKVPMHIKEPRVTLKFVDPNAPPSWPHLSQQECESLEVDAVAPSAPREEMGFYWGYNVRRADCLSNIWAESEYPKGYDFTIGTSERGVPLKSILPDDIAPRSREPSDAVKKLPARFEHLLVVFGGVAGLEPAVANDPVLGKKLRKETAHEAFDAWVNLVQGQGSRTIRTEEAVEIGLFALKDYVDSQHGYQA